jgi:hypothetical protein
LLALVVTVGLFLPAPASADSDDAPGPDEHTEQVVPGVAPADDRPASTFLSQAQVVDATAARVIGTPIEDFAYDPLVLKGTAREVCAGRLLTGSGWVYNELVSRFGGTPGTMYYCRERWDAANDPDCNGTLVNPAANPNFYSTCWSNHARGRAIDVMVGQVAGGYNRTRGLSIVNWLLAIDANGNVNANARAMGVQQILFDDRCWNSEGDRGITSWNSMRSCGVGHHDHVHIDLTLRGANGTVSYWGATPVIAPKLDTQVLWDQQAAYREAVSWWNLQTTDEEGLSMPAGYDRAIAGDWDSDGLIDEILLWDIDTGNWILQNWTDGDSLNARVGKWTVGYDELIAGDWDSDGHFDDMILWDTDTGRYVVHSWSGYASTYRGGGTWTRGYTQLINGDFDGDGRRDDAIMWNNRSGSYVIHSWQNFRFTFRAGGSWPSWYDEVIVGDWSAGGDFDETLVWDRDSGRWVLHSWSQFHWTYVTSGNWGAAITAVAPGDYDTDGRVDDVLLYSGITGRFYLWSFHRDHPTVRTTGTWLPGYDVITVGMFLN